jgi:hypothetical protein
VAGLSVPSFELVCGGFEGDSGVLRLGLQLNSAGVSLAGTPTMAGSNNFFVTLPTQLSPRHILVAHLSVFCVYLHFLTNTLLCNIVLRLNQEINFYVWDVNMPIFLASFHLLCNSSLRHLPCH